MIAFLDVEFNVGVIPLELSEVTEPQIDQGDVEMEEDNIDPDELKDLISEETLPNIGQKDKQAASQSGISAQTPAGNSQ